MQKQLRALSLQLVVLAIWKQAMQICHRASAASAVIEGSPSRDRRMRSRPGSYNNSSSLSLTDSELADAIRPHIEKDFLVEVTHAEELASCIGYISGYHLFFVFYYIALIDLPRYLAYICTHSDKTLIYNIVLIL